MYIFFSVYFLTFLFITGFCFCFWCLFVMCIDVFLKNQIWKNLTMTSLLFLSFSLSGTHVLDASDGFVGHQDYPFNSQFLFLCYTLV